MKLKDKYGGNYLFLIGVLIIYIITGLVNYTYFIHVFNSLIIIFIDQILLVIFIVFIIMFILNFALAREVIQKKLINTKNSIKYVLAVLGGIFSIGPVYMRYPFLKKLMNHGFHYGHIATFIYARSIKIPFLAIMVFYFGFLYTIIFNITLIFLSLFLGIIIFFIFNFLYHEY